MLSVVASLLHGELHDQDGILAREPYQHHDADLGVEVVGQAGDPERQHGPDDANGDGQQHRHGHSPGLVERDQEQIGEKYGEPQHDRRLASRLLLLQGGAVPLVGVAGG